MGLPTISGLAQTNAVLSFGKGSWTGSPTGYVWQQNVSTDGGVSYSLVSGASGVPGVDTYTIPSNAEGWYYKVTVTASNAAGSTPANSAALGAVSGPVIVPPAQGLTIDATHITGSDGGQVTIVYADAHTEAEIASALASVNGYTYTVHRFSAGHYAVNEQTAGSSPPPASWWLDSNGA